MRTASLLLIAVFVLSACSGFSTQSPPGDVKAPVAQTLEELQVWTAKGKASLRNNNAAESVSLIWDQNQNEANIVLSGPLGAGATQIYSDGEILTINRNGSQDTIDISSPEAIVSNTGWDLPLQALPYWLKGLPAPELKVQGSRRDATSGSLTALRQEGWSLELTRYTQLGSLRLPNRIRLEKADTKILVVIRHWELGGAP